MAPTVARLRSFVISEIVPDEPGLPSVGTSARSIPATRPRNQKFSLATIRKFSPGRTSASNTTKLSDHTRTRYAEGAVIESSGALAGIVGAGIAAGTVVEAFLRKVCAMGDSGRLTTAEAFFAS